MKKTRFVVHKQQDAKRVCESLYGAPNAKLELHCQADCFWIGYEQGPWLGRITNKRTLRALRDRLSDLLDAKR